MNLKVVTLWKPVTGAKADTLGRLKAETLGRPVVNMKAETISRPTAEVKAETLWKLAVKTKALWKPAAKTGWQLIGKAGSQKGVH